MCAGKAYCAAAIRQGIGYLEVPFFATADHRRNKGYGRALLEVLSGHRSSHTFVRCHGQAHMLLAMDSLLQNHIAKPKALSRSCAIHQVQC